MDNNGIDAVFIILSVFSGVSLLVWTSVKAKVVRIKAERPDVQSAAVPQEGAVLAELKALKQQMAEMHSTSHQFDLSFDETLSRMEGRVGRLETKSAASASVATETPNTLRNGQNQ